MRILLLLVLLLPTGCQGVVREWQQDRLVAHLSKLKSYHGIIRETGILDSKEDLVSEIWFSQPMKYFMKIKSPEKFAGSTLVYNGDTLYIYFPKTKYAILYRNLLQLSAEDMKRLIGDQFNSNMDHYQYEIAANRKVLDVETVTLLFKSKTEHSLVSSGSMQVYDAFSLPLSTELGFREGPKYKTGFDSIEINISIPEGKFALPKDPIEIRSEWDFGQAGLDENAAKKAANFPFALSKTVPTGFQLLKIIKQKGPVPAFIAVYGKHPFFIYVASFKDYGVNLIPRGRGIRLKGGDLIPNPHLSSYAFVKNEVQYSIVGNASIDDLVQVGGGF